MKYIEVALSVHGRTVHIMKDEEAEGDLVRHMIEADLVLRSPTRQGRREGRARKALAAAQEDFG